MGQKPSIKERQFINITILTLLFLEITCLALAIPLGGTSGCADNPVNYGLTCDVSCSDGFFQSGEKTRTCGGDGSSATGTWTGTDVSCQRE